MKNEKTDSLIKKTLLNCTSIDGMIYLDIKRIAIVSFFLSPHPHFLRTCREKRDTASSYNALTSSLHVEPECSLYLS